MIARAGSLGYDFAVNYHTQFLRFTMSVGLLCDHVFVFSKAIQCYDFMNFDELKGTSTGNCMKETVTGKWKIHG